MRVLLRQCVRSACRGCPSLTPAAGVQLQGSGALDEGGRWVPGLSSICLHATARLICRACAGQPHFTLCLLRTQLPHHGYLHTRIPAPQLASPSPFPPPLPLTCTQSRGPPPFPLLHTRPQILGVPPAEAPRPLPQADAEAAREQEEVEVTSRAASFLPPLVDIKQQAS